MIAKIVIANTPNRLNINNHKNKTSFSRLYLDSAPVHAHNVPALLNAYAHVLNHCRPAAAWDCKAPFGSNTNRASDKYSFLMSLSLDRCTTFCAVLHILFAV